MSLKLQIIVGSVTGTAQRVGEFVAKKWADEFHIEVNPFPSITDLLRDQDELLLFCVSNTGVGDLPDDVIPLFEALDEQQPDLSNRKIFLVNLGDSMYASFGNSGKKIEDILTSCKAKLLSERLLVDASEQRYPQKYVNEWFASQLTKHELLG